MDSSKFKFVKKKAISPVVATALLLVVAVISVVGFQGWFTAFSSSVFTDVEVDTQKSSSQVGVEDLVGDILYINSGDNLSIKSISIGGTDCNINSSFSGLAKIDVSSCIENLTNPAANILVITDDGIYDSYQYLDSASSSSSGGSGGSGGTASCLLDGVTVTHTNSSTFYDSKFAGSCNSLVRTCTDGTLDGSALYLYSNCIVDVLGYTQISTCTDLENMANNLSGNYQLTQNIDCSGIPSFTAIGGDDIEYYSGLQKGFTGNLEGNQFTISNLNINRAALDGAGLFTRNDGDVSNLKIVNASVVSSGNWIGILAGVKRDGSIKQVSVSGTVNGGSDVGAIVGRMGSAVLQNSHSLGTVIGTQTVGGLVGMNYNGNTILDSYTTANVSSSGGIVGGLVGANDGGSTITNSFNSNPVSASSNVGGVTGWFNSGTFTNVYWNDNANNPSAVFGISSTTGVTTISDNEAHFYSGSNAPMSSWDSNWTFSGSDYPTLSFE